MCKAMCVKIFYKTVRGAMVRGLWKLMFTQLFKYITQKLYESLGIFLDDKIKK